MRATSKLRVRVHRQARQMKGKSKRENRYVIKVMRLKQGRGYGVDKPTPVQQWGLG